MIYGTKGMKMKAIKILDTLHGYDISEIEYINIDDYEHLRRIETISKLNRNEQIECLLVLGRFIKVFEENTLAHLLKVSRYSAVHDSEVKDISVKKEIDYLAINKAMSGGK